MTAWERLIAALQDNGCKVATGGRASTCPAHEDKAPSLSIGDRTDRDGVVVKCHAGCHVDDVLAAVGMRAADLFDDDLPHGRAADDWTPCGHPKVAEYRYTDEAGELLFAVARCDRKGNGCQGFRQWRPDPSAKGGKRWSLADTRRTPYRLPAVLAAAKASQQVYIVEGEKDVHAAERVGAVATCNPGGAGKWRDEYSAALAGAHAVVVTDLDEPGRRHAAHVAGCLTGVAASVRVVEPAAGKDLSDHLAAGHTLDDLKPAASPSGGDDREQQTAEFARDVDHHVYDLRVRDAARRKLAAERGGDVQRPPVVPLRDFLDQPDPDVAYRVERLWPAGGRVVVAAQWKAGKSTMVGNVARALADGAPFLDQFPTVPAGRTVLIDDELDEATLRRWLRAQGITAVDALRVVSLRGRVATFDLLDPTTRREWATGDLAGAEVIILDCLRPVLDALGLDESRDAGRFLVALDALLREVRAGCGGAQTAEALVVHHMGHHGERSRGDSRILDWPDATWNLVREDSDDPASPRYLKAYGRDVDVPEGRLAYDETTRRLCYAGGTRRDSAADALWPDLAGLLGAHDGMTGRQVETAMRERGHTQTDVRQALRRAVDEGRLSTSPGPRRAVVHRLPGAVRGSAWPVRDALSGECVSASIGRTPLTRTLEECVAPRTHSLSSAVETTRTEAPAPSAPVEDPEVPSPHPPDADTYSASIGPCSTCGRSTRRYGEGGSPLCPSCNTARVTGRSEGGTGPLGATILQESP